MPEPFSRSLRSLALDSSRRSGWMGVVILILGAWAVWFFAIPVTLYEVSQQARLELERPGHPVAPQVAGRLIASTLAIGRRVTAGDVLAELDGETERRRVEEERSRLAALHPQVEALGREIAAEEETRRHAREMGRSALEGARERVTEAEADARYAEEEARRLTQFKEALAELEVLRAQTEGKKKRAAAGALEREMRRLQADQESRDSQSQARAEQLRRNLALLEGQMATTSASIAVLEQEIEKHLIRAPTTGRIAEIAALQPGTVLRAGESIATVIPTGELKAVAEFAPEAAFGRIRQGQTARIRLEGFPWLQYGTVSARVDSVANETRGGRVRVELEVLADASSRIPLEHGLPGTVEIEVERVLPATLALRMAGKLATSALPPAQPAGTNPEASRSERR